LNGYLISHAWEKWQFNLDNQSESSLKYDASHIQEAIETRNFLKKIGVTTIENEKIKKIFAKAQFQHDLSFETKEPSLHAKARAELLSALQDYLGSGIATVPTN
jgi:hypothetical protein